VDAERGRSFWADRRIDTEGMTRRELYIQRLGQERERTEVKLAERSVELERVRAEYLQAAKERKVLDKLKERRAAEYYEKQKDEEFRVIDDMNTAHGQGWPKAGAGTDAEASAHGRGWPKAGADMVDAAR